MIKIIDVSRSADGDDFVAVILEKDGEYRVIDGVLTFDEESITDEDWEYAEPIKFEGGK